MPRKLIGVALIVLAAAACSSEEGTTTTTAAGTATEAAVSIADFTFSPSAVTVAVGQTVTWTNDDGGLAHTSTSPDGVWNSGTLQPGDTFSFAFEEAGTFDYACNIHPSMSGTITVEG